MKRKSVIVILSAILLAVISMRMYRNRKTEIVSSFRDEYSVVIYMVGDPEFPFGSTHCLAVLKKGNRTVGKQPIELRNDGKIADESDFEIIWMPDSLIIRASGEEMEDEEYVLDLQK